MKSGRGLIRPFEGTLSFLFRIIDIALIVLVLHITTHIKTITWNEHYSFIVVLGVAFFIFFTSHFEIYRSWRIARVYDEILQIWLAWFLTAMSVVVVVFLTKTSADYSRLAIGSWFIATAFVFGLWRMIARNVLYEFRRKGFNTRSVAIVGANNLGLKLSGRISNASWMGLRFAGFFDDRLSANENRLSIDQSQVTGGTAELVEKAVNNQIDIVYITYPLRAEERTNRLIKKLSDTTTSVYLVPDFNVFNMLNGRWSQIDEFPIVSIHETPHIGLEGWVKRIEDITIATIALLVLSVPLALIAFGVKLSSRGTIFFKQTRYGIDGRPIRVWKFRTMTVMEDDSSVVQATRNDPRVTPFGRFLRQSSLDELPQLLNVLRGDMSIVGPRPHAVAHNEQYRKLIDGYMLRHTVKPGITGLAQVKGFRGETETLEKMQARVEYDLEYIKNWSILLDLKLIFLTLFIGFRQRNAY